MCGVGVSRARWASADVNQLLQSLHLLSAQLCSVRAIFMTSSVRFHGKHAFLFCITRSELFGLSDVISSEFTFVIASGMSRGKQKGIQNLVAHIRKAHLDFTALL